jgi:formate dehydrogenase iron-sulfur subunit
MIYHDTHRALWCFPRTALRFFGCALSFAALSFLIVQPESSAFQALFAASVITKLSAEIRFLRHAKSQTWSPDQQSARLQIGPLRIVLIARISLACFAALTSLSSPWLALPLLLAAEVLERQLFFQSVQAPKMPGGFIKY